MSARLQILPEECSPLGKLVLQHMEEHGVSMREIARLAGISQPGLRSVCLGTYPTDSTLQKLAQALNRSYSELSRLAYGRKVEGFQEEPVITGHKAAIAEELFAAAEEMGLALPETISSSKNLREQLIGLGFKPRQ